MINGWNFFEQPVKNNLIRYDNIQKIATFQGDYYTNLRLLDYSYFKSYYKMITIDLSKIANKFYCKSTARWKYNKDVKINYFRFFTRIFESIVNLLYFSLILE